MLYYLGYFILGNLAYSIDSFVLPPYDQPYSRSLQVIFHHSSAIITVECDFGEIDLRWGIFWKCLTCSLQYISLIVEGSIRLDNYIVDHRDKKYSQSQGSKKLMAIEKLLKKSVFELDCYNNTVSCLVRGQDSDRGRKDLK